MSLDLCRSNSDQRLPGVAVILSSVFEPVSAIDNSACRSIHSSPHYLPSNDPTSLGPPRKSCIDLPPERNPPSELSFNHRTGPFVSTGMQDFDPIGLRYQRHELYKQSSPYYQVQHPRRPNVYSPRLELLNSVEPCEDDRLKLRTRWSERQQRQHSDGTGIGLQQMKPLRSNDDQARTILNNITGQSLLSSIPLSKGFVPSSSGSPTPFQDALQTSIPATESTFWTHTQLPQQISKNWHDHQIHPHRYQPDQRRCFNDSIDQTARSTFGQQLSAFLPSISPPYSALRSALPTIGHLPLTPRESTLNTLPEEKIKETYPSPPSTDHSFKKVLSFAPLPLSLEDLVDPAPVRSDSVDDDVRISGQILVGLAKGRTPMLGLGVGFDRPPAKMGSVTIAENESTNEAKTVHDKDESDGDSESNDEIIPTTRTPSPLPMSRSAEAIFTQSKRIKKRTSALPVSSTIPATETSFRRSCTKGPSSALGSASTPITKTTFSSRDPLDPTATTSFSSVGTSDRANKVVTPKNSKRRAKKQRTKISMENYDPEHSRPFGCDMCLERFLRKNDYVRHQRIHSGDKPYVCPICSTGFMRNDALLRHIDHTSACAAQAPSREEFVFGLGGLKRRKSFAVSAASEPSHGRNHKRRKV